MTTTFRSLALLLVAAAVGLASGCRTPLIGGTRGTPGLGQPGTPNGLATPTVPGVGTTNIDWNSGAGEWTPQGDSLSNPDGVTGVQEKRWEGVAVYFAYDRSTIGASERAKVEKLAEYLLERVNYTVIVEGHCDERGSDEYNRALGERRALAVKDYLVALGVGAERIRTLSYGIERPAVPNATTETQHGKNRRAEFVLGIAQ